MIKFYFKINIKKFQNIFQLVEEKKINKIHYSNIYSVYNKMSNTTQFSLLSNKAILQEVKDGNIVCKPELNPKNLGTNSYDVTLNKTFYREVKTFHNNEKFSFYDLLIPTLMLLIIEFFSSPKYLVSVQIAFWLWYASPFSKEITNRFFNPYSYNSVNKTWGKCHQALTKKNWCTKNSNCLQDIDWTNIKENDLIIVLEPGENILAQTRESIGGKNNVTTMMKARSSAGRSFIEVCSCSGLGDIGYVGKWTMEIRNNATNHHVVLVVGTRIAQICFFKTDGLLNSAEYSGKYKGDSDPSDMLPKMYLDREVLEIAVAADVDADESESDEDSDDESESEEGDDNDNNDDDKKKENVDEKKII